jgi:diaminopimelate decarboxylase
MTKISPFPTPPSRLFGLDIAAFSRDRATPFFLISENSIASAYEGLQHHLRHITRKKTFYSLKTNYETPVLTTLRGLGAGVEVYRQAELEIALAAGFKGPDIIMNGCSKTHSDLEAALENKLALVNTESWDEIRMLNDMARANGIEQPIGMRIGLGIQQFPSLFNFVALRQSKPFGFNRVEMESLFSRLKSMENLQLVCLSAHMTAPIFKPRFFGARVQLLFEMANKARKQGHPVDRIDMGGGYPSEASMRHNWPVFMGSLPLLKKKKGRVMAGAGKSIRETYQRCAQRFGFEPMLMLEPGRYLVDDAMAVIGRVIGTKGRSVFVDISAVTEVAYHPQFLSRKIEILGNTKQGLKIETFKICGPTLLPFDVIGPSYKGPKPNRGDLVMIQNVGAYCTVSSKAFMLPRCACYFIDRNGKTRLSRRPESYKDMIRTQVMASPDQPIIN